MNKLIFLCLPNLLTELCPPAGQHEVDEDIPSAEVLASQHLRGEHVPAGEGLSVSDPKNIRVALLLANLMAGYHIAPRDPNTSLLIHHPQDHVKLSLRPKVVALLPE